MDTTELTEEQVAFVQRLMQAAGDDGVILFTETVTLEDGKTVERTATLRPDPEIPKAPKHPGKVLIGHGICHRCGDVVEEYLSYTERYTNRKVKYCVPCADATGNQTVYNVYEERLKAGYYNRPRNKVCI